MKRFLLGTYDFFTVRKPLFYSTTLVLFVVLGVVATQIKTEEDVSRLLPNGEETRQITDILKSSNFADKVIVKVKAETKTEPEILMQLADSVRNKLLNNYSTQIAEIKSEVSDETALEVYNTVYSHLPIYLDSSDYRIIDSLISPKQTPQTLADNYTSLTSASGFIMKKLIADDPVGISSIALRKLQQLQIDENYDIYDGYIMSKDHQSVYLFITLKNTAGETAKNEKLLDGLDEIIASLKLSQGISILYYGNPVVAAGNAQQLKKDSILTLSITIVSILIFIGFFFRRKRVPFIMMLPVVFGGVFSLAIIALTQGAISSIALGAGSIVLGIAVNYSLHFFSHYKHCGSIKETISDLMSPMTIGSFTTVGSFLALTLLQSQILNDFGLFAGLSLAGATIFALIFLPHFVPPLSKVSVGETHEATFERRLNFQIKHPGITFLIVLFITIVLFQYAKDVRFESDLNKVNFLDAKTRHAQKEIDITQDDTAKLVFIAATGKSEQEMLRNNEALMTQLETAKANGWIQKYSSISHVIPSEQLQQIKIERWNKYWTEEKKNSLLATLKQEGSKLGFSPIAFQNFDTLLHKHFKVAKESDFAAIKSAFGSEYLLPFDKEFRVINAVRVDKLQRPQLYAELSRHPSTVVLDKQIITNKFVEIIVSDFNSILLYTSVLVFLALLFSYGRLELTLLTFLPMVFAWIWILGIMSLLNIPFNLINIIISTFIFGLGDDFSIFITDGLSRKYKEGKEMLAAHKVSIFLCAVTVLIGLGALIFAKHPALKSIALISIIGIFCVVFIGQTVQPFLFRFFIQNRQEKGLPPWTLPTLFLTFIAFSYYVSVSLLVSLVGYLLLYLVPFPGKKKRKLFFHHLVCNALKLLTYMMMNVRKTHVGKENMDFSKPAVIIANHASFLDILVTVMQHPKLILLTNHWVYYSPVFGKVVQLADYYPVMEGVNPAIDKFEEIVRDGYSIVVFPEGTRSPDGKLKRFHKGAFYLAEKLNIDIVPMLLHGTGDTIRKGDFMVMNSSMTMKFLPRITPDDATFGNGYAERTKNISRYFRSEFEKLREEKETPRYFRQRLRMNYIYKGPELEWIALKESRNESFYDALCNTLPRHGSITEIGCGYGLICYMLHFTGWNRMITGIDKDETRIDIANNCYSKNEQINFVVADTTGYTFVKQDAYIIHQKNLLLSDNEFKTVLAKCFDNLSADGVMVYIGEEMNVEGYSTEAIHESIFRIKKL